MGAALTYARRYALFTLVGIAGEDDPDAPDLCDGPPSSSADSGASKDIQLRMPVRPPGNGRVHRDRKQIPVALDPEQSAALREELLTDLWAITSADLAAAWAVDALPAKNTLTATDAKLVEDAFERRLSELVPSEATEPSNANSLVPQIAAPQIIDTSEKTHAGEAKRIDKSILAVAAPRRYRNREHLRYVAQQACLVCGRKPSDPHHLRYLQPRALGRKASDEFAVPLCRSHHRAVHRAGDEQAWWKAAGIDPVKVARTLWRQTRLDDPQEHHLTDLVTDQKVPDATAESRSD